MAFRVFLDANILLDFLLKRADYVSSKKLMELIIEGKVQGYVTPAIIHILAYWLGKAYGSTKARHLIQTLINDILVIDCTHNMVEIALQSKIEDIEDALQYYTAIEHKLNYFISRDKQLKKSAIYTLPVLNLDEFLAISNALK